MTHLGHRSLSKSISGVETEVFLQHFADRVLVIITQLGKVGCLIQASIPSTTAMPITQPRQDNSRSFNLPNPHPAIELQKIFGTTPSNEDDLYSLYASQVATLVWTFKSDGAFGGERRNVIVGLAFKKKTNEGYLADEDRLLYTTVMEMILELLQNET